MKRTCSICGKEISNNIALFSVNHKLPSEGREYACWECLTTEGRVRHMRNERKEGGDD